MIFTQKLIFRIHSSLNLIAKNQKQPKCTLTGEWLTKWSMLYYEMLFSSERKQAIDIHNLYGSQENWAELGVGGI